ncbi:hypothetical protein D3C72_1723470 [compost metagenome]
MHRLQDVDVGAVQRQSGAQGFADKVAAHRRWHRVVSGAGLLAGGKGAAPGVHAGVLSIVRGAKLLFWQAKDAEGEMWKNYS